MTETATGETENQDTQQEAGATAEEGSASDTRSELEALLAEGESADANDVKPAETPADDGKWETKYKALETRFEALESRIVSRETESALDETIKAIQTSDDNLEGVDPRVVRAMLKDAADENPEIEKAFMAQRSNPKRWAQIRGALAKDISQTLSGVPNAKLTNDRRAVAEASRGVSTSEPQETGNDIPPQEELSKMSVAQLQQLASRG